MGGNSRKTLCFNFNACKRGLKMILEINFLTKKRGGGLIEKSFGHESFLIAQSCLHKIFIVVHLYMNNIGKAQVNEVSS